MTIGTRPASGREIAALQGRPGRLAFGPWLVGGALFVGTVVGGAVLTVLLRLLGLAEGRALLVGALGGFLAAVAALVWESHRAAAAVGQGRLQRQMAHWAARVVVVQVDQVLGGVRGSKVTALGAVITWVLDVGEDRLLLVSLPAGHPLESQDLDGRPVQVSFVEETGALVDASAGGAAAAAAGTHFTLSAGDAPIGDGFALDRDVQWLTVEQAAWVCDAG